MEASRFEGRSLDSVFLSVRSLFDLLLFLFLFFFEIFFSSMREKKRIVSYFRNFLSIKS